MFEALNEKTNSDVFFSNLPKQQETSQKTLILDKIGGRKKNFERFQLKIIRWISTRRISFCDVRKLLSDQIGKSYLTKCVGNQNFHKFSAMIVFVSIACVRKAKQMQKPRSKSSGTSDFVYQQVLDLLQILNNDRELHPLRDKLFQVNICFSWNTKLTFIWYRPIISVDFCFKIKKRIGGERIRILNVEFINGSC